MLSCEFIILGVASRLGLALGCLSLSFVGFAVQAAVAWHGHSRCLRSVIEFHHNMHESHSREESVREGDSASHRLDELSPDSGLLKQR